MFADPDFTIELVPTSPRDGRSPFAPACGLPLSQQMAEEQNGRALADVIEHARMQAAVTALVAAEANRRQRMLRKSKAIMFPIPDCTLTKKEVAARCRVTERTVDRYVEAGLLRGHRLGSSGSCRYKPEDVERLLIAEKTAEQVADDLEAHINKNIGG